jgi:hypothetical protein
LLSVPRSYPVEIDLNDSVALDRPVNEFKFPYDDWIFSNDSLSAVDTSDDVLFTKESETVPVPNDGSEPERLLIKLMMLVL